jgi:hypothetical protein
MRGSFRVHSVIDILALAAIALVAASRDRARPSPIHPAAPTRHSRPLVVATEQPNLARDPWGLN